jgi:hypothetical protein
LFLKAELLSKPILWKELYRVPHNLLKSIVEFQSANPREKSSYE